MTGIDELRNAVSLFDGCHESFNQSERNPFTAEQLLQIYRMHQKCECECDFYPDEWTYRQVKEALAGKPPQWDEEEKVVYK